MQGLRGVISLGLEESTRQTVNIAGGRGRPELVHMMYADRGLLPTLDIEPLLGRNFSAAEESPQGPPVVILTWRFWQQQFGGEHDVIGHTLLIEGVTHTIVGVLPKSFAALGFEGAIVLPMALPPGDMSNANKQIAVGRLSSSASLAMVSSELEPRMRAVSEALKDASARILALGRHFGAENFKAFLHDGDRPVLALFLVSALFVLAIALVNLTNLMMVRALSRSHDLAVRNALGAPLLRQLLPSLAEGLLVGVGGASLGLALAFIGLHFLQGFVPGDWLNGASLRIGAAAVGLAFVIGVLGTLLAAGIGLRRGCTAGTMEELRAGGGSGISRDGNRLGRTLVVLQVVLATALLCVVSLFLHTLYDAERAPLGFAPGNTLTFEMKPLKAAYPNAAAMDLLAKRLTRRLEAIPGVSRASATTNLPSGGFINQLYAEMTTPGGQGGFESSLYGVGLGFFHVFGIHLRGGRLFTADDVRGGEKVAIVSQAVADRYYNDHAIGKLLLTQSNPSGLRIVGVVNNIYQEGASINHTYEEGALTGAPPVVYVPLAQMTSSLDGFVNFEGMHFALQVRGNPYSYREAVQKAVALVAPNQPIANFRSMRDVVASATAPLRLNLLLIGIFAALALLLAAAGLYAVMSVAVATREHEFGVRTALGATPAALLRLVLRDGMVQTGIGLVLGVILALTLSVAMSSVVESLGSTRVIDPPSIIGACIVLALVGLLACALPAMRAARVEPMRALRGE